MSMRAGPLSDPQIIHLLNSSFIPVLASNEDYRQKGRAAAEERALYRQIRDEAEREGRHEGSVCVYLVAPDGDGFDSLTVSQAVDTPRLRRMLESAIVRLQVTPGKVLVPPARQNKPPAPPPGGITLYVVSRSNASGTWSGLPGESWVLLEPAEWRALLPDPSAVPGDSWTIRADVAEKILTHVHPATRISSEADQRLPTGPHGHQVESAELQGKVLAREGNVMRVRFDGHVQIKRAARPYRPDDNRAAATIVGFAELDIEQNQLRSLQLISGEGRYDDFEFRVAIQLIDS